ncbi:3-dehydroquinate synthase [Desulfurivibrio alkaliphilus]|uniref:3-dehydroquinate synthase n=1 Tax=Desulfurivibrio alkaliphilus (strain DSM 19089 / UNIQEM U267 / AHT2) TaxID=589865 RepID=D6Z6P6_DESAT|nr:3-dehydroquinate synthase [Desulfurivibrio alkaliphilus]ADH85005.1 3-dehydroquinate synthase [Desulfurivibrio alkaliphilus AHT 2]
MERQGAIADATAVPVGLGARSYEILIRAGLLAEVGRDLAGLGIARRWAVVADDRVASLFGRELQESLAAAGIKAELLTFPHGEESKHLATVAELASGLARLGLDRGDGLIALGGGVSGDITGFLASIYLRGIPFVQVPTTLLAQVDSSVGGKTGVDIPEGKNLVGTFYQPRRVYIDTAVLERLPEGELLNGLAEVIKYGMIYDAAFLRRLKEQRQAILALERPVLAGVIARCCAIKAEVVAADEREADLRRILNFGHTLGHAVEAASGYTLAHGRAVAIGMAAVGEIAADKGLWRQEEADELRQLLTEYGLPVQVPPELDRQQIKKYLKTDKKTVAGRPFFVLPTAPGKVIITDEVTEAQIDRALAV